MRQPEFLSTEEMFKYHGAILRKLVKYEAFLMDYVGGNVSRNELMKKATMLLAEGQGLCENLRLKGRVR